MKAKALVKNVRGTRQDSAKDGSEGKGEHPFQAADLRDSAPDALEEEQKRHAETRRKLEETGAELQLRTEECDELKERYEAAFRGAQIHAFSQDRDLRYLWVSGPHGEEGSARMVGKTDEELWPSPELQAAITTKRRVLETGKPEDCEVSFITPERRALFALHIDPIFAADGSVKGILCTAVDISRIRSMESEQRQLNEETAI